MTHDIYLSVVVPVYNEEACLESLYGRLTAVLEKIGKPWEIIFTDDGSKDQSIHILKEFHKRRPEQIRIIEFNGNFGQHMAIMAAFERVRGQVIVNMGMIILAVTVMVAMIHCFYAHYHQNLSIGCEN